MKILVAGATGSIGLHVVNTAIEMGHHPVALVRNRRKVKLLPRGTDVFYGWNQRTEVHDWKRRAERLVRASGHPYTIVRPGWFDYNNDDEHRIVMLQGDRRHAGTPEDGVVSREQIAQVLVSALTSDEAKNKTFELVAEQGEAQQDLTLLFADLQTDNPEKNDGVLDLNNMPFSEEPECIINELNLFSKHVKSI